MGIVVYRGPSQIDGQPIVGVLVLHSENTKTGDMAQLFIMREDLEPHEAQRTGDDVSVCGDCPLRPSTVRARRAAGVSAEDSPFCYVKTFQGPLSTWRVTRGQAANLARAVCGLMLLEGEHALRLGAYGDPAALPEHVVATLVAAAGGRATGYTHQWREYRYRWLRRYAMASCDTPNDFARAAAEGWRSFRVITRRSLPVLGAREIQCPSDRGIQCRDCRLCDGSRGQEDKRKHITILAH